MPRFKISELIEVSLSTLRDYIRELDIKPVSYTEIEHEGKIRTHGCFSSTDVISIWKHHNTRRLKK